MTPRTRFYIVASIAVLFISAGATAFYCIRSYYQGQNLNARAYRELMSGHFETAIPLYDEASHKLMDSTARALVYGNRGWCYTKRGNDDQAIRDFTESIRLDPGPLYSVLDRGLAYYRKGEFDKALVDFDTTLKKEPNAAEAHYRRALIFFWKGELPLAIASYNEAIRCDPNNPQLFAERGMAYGANEQFDEAIASFDSAIRLSPTLPTAYINRAKAYARKGDPDKGLADVNAAIEAMAGPPQLIFARAYIYLDRGLLEKAEPDIEEAMRLAPNSEIPYLLRAWARALDRNWPEAVRDAQRAVEINPAIGYAHYLLGRGFTGMGRYDEAIAELDIALRLEPGVVWTMYFRAQNYAYRQEYSRARDELRRTVERFPKNPASHLALAWFLATCPHDAYRDGDQAVAEAIKGCELLRWADASAADALGAAYAEQGDFENAIKFAQMALSIPGPAPKDRALTEWRLARYQLHLAVRDLGGAEITRSLFEEGVNAYANQDYDRALKCFNMVLPPNPGASVCASLFHFFDGTYDKKFRPPWAPEETAEMTNAFYYRGLAHEKKREWDDAIADFSATIWRNPTSRLALAERGFCYERKGKAELAFRDLDEMNRLNPDDALPYALRADFLQMNGDTDRAIEAAEISVRLDPKLVLAHDVLGRIFTARKQNDAADREFDEAERLEPNHVRSALESAHAFNRKHAYTNAEIEFRETAQRFPRSAYAQNAVAWFLASCPEKERRNGSDAVRLATVACELNKWNESASLDTLAAAYAETGDFSNAVKYVKEALAHKPDEEDLKEIQEHLVAFERKEPWREKR
jgi:tetratricopeptide (TPR) repeat protein